MLARHRRARRGAGLIELAGRNPIDVGGELQHRVLRGVEDQRARPEVLGAELLNSRDPVVGTIADDLVAHRLHEALDHLRGEPCGVGRLRALEHHPHELPVAAHRVLAGPQRVQAAVDGGVLDGGHALQRQDGPEAELAQCGQLQTADGLGEMGQRVGARVAVVAGVGERTGPARVDHEHDRPPVGRGRGGAQREARGCALK